MSKRILLPALVVALVLAIAAAGAVFAQTATPAPSTPSQSQSQTQTPAGPDGLRGFGPGGFGLGGQQDWTEFDAVASALKLTPTQLFDQLHSGKDLTAIAQAQGVDITTVQQAAQAARTTAEKNRIEQAVQNGTMTQDQANWLLQGIQNGWTGGFGFGGGHGRGGFGGRGGNTAPANPSNPASPSTQATPSTGTQG